MKFHLKKPLRDCLLLTSLLYSLFLVACNNTPAPANTDGSGTAAQSSALPSDSAAKEDVYNFIDACMENNPPNVDKAKAFAHCKCMEAQIRQKFGNTDSAAVVKLQADTAMLANFVRQCK